METLDGFIINLFRNEKPVIQEKDFNNPDVWVCDLLNDDIELAKKYILHRLTKAEKRIDKKQFLFDCRSCFTYTIEHDYFDNPETKVSYQKALALVETAIKHYDDCEQLKNCKADNIQFLTGRYKENYLYNENFEIENFGETRKYTSIEYLDSLLENYYLEVDKQETFNKRLYILNKALFHLERLINEYDLKDCDKVIKDIKLTIDFETKQASFNLSPNTTSLSCFKLVEKRGVKTDLIRILNSIYELKFVEKTNGQLPSKEEFMIQAGHFFGVDLSKYDTDLSQALNNTALEANLKIFEKMKEITQKGHFISKEPK
ncbi:MAG: hypothetical protein ACK40G_16145 [Cytophagaceae bacterium]